MSGDLYATGGRHWVSSKDLAHCFGEDLEAAQYHADTFRDPVTQTSLRVTHRFREIPGHRGARVVGFLDD